VAENRIGGICVKRIEKPQDNHQGGGYEGEIIGYEGLN
jgi:hypothetical protein